MKPILINPAYAAPVSYFRVLLSGLPVVLDIHSNYQKRSYLNRCEILGANGKLMLSIPLVHGKGQKQPLNTVRISYAENWQKDHWMSLVSAYRRAPFFEYYEADFHPFYDKQWELLADFNRSYLETLIRLLNLDIRFELSENYIEPGAFNGTDARQYSLQFESKPVRPYLQVFSDRFEFVPDLSILDALFNLGSRTRDYLLDLNL